MSTRPQIAALLIVVLIGASSPSFAEEGPAAPVSTANVARQLSQPHLLLPVGIGPLPQVTFAQQRVHYCCNLTGMMIGAAIGAGAAGMIAWSVCEGGCTRTNLKVMATWGSIGAVVGALANGSARR